MKHWWGIALLVAAGSVRGQSLSRAPFPGATELVVHVADSGARAAERAGRVLLARGYALRPSPAAQGVETLPRVVQPQPRVTATVRVRVLGRYLVVQGWLQGADSLRRPPVPVGYPNPYRTRSGSRAMAWDELEAIARDLQGTVWYQGPINPLAK